MNQQTTAVEIGEITIPILKGGFFDRYRLNPDLDVIQEEFDIENMSFFEGVEKAPFEHGPMGSMSMVSLRSLALWGEGRARSGTPGN